jgi:polyphosphate kinase 2 (PPK2 family)
MSKKEKKPDKKNVGDESTPQDGNDVQPVLMFQQFPSTIAPGMRFRINKKAYEKELIRLQKEMIKLQEWIRHRKPQSARVPGGGTPCADRAGKDTMVFSALCRASARRRGDSVI